MSNYTLKDVAKSSDRYKLYTMLCNPEEVPECIAFLRAHEINVVNIGKELAIFIAVMEDDSYLNFDVFDYTKKLLDDHKSKINHTGNDLLAIYNLGILLEPALELNAMQLLKEFSKSAALIIIWENQSEIPGQLHWPTQQSNFFFDFSETPIKKLLYEI